ncbi:hypothetical protein [uncultured Draconibacterium sp.]|uniref:hypothetical protein n=1 Tax=uncultured Draconibacterium sp. TaxID=1573823 RepID=UPI0025D36758|nr:hypothetical protein [uncultured Draconibacterium sp.]
MQKEETKANNTRKKYGKPYEDKEHLRHGDIQLIATASGYKYVSVVQQLSGERKMQAAVKAAADRLVRENKKLISTLSPSDAN